MITTTVCFEARCDECTLGFGGYDDALTVHYPDSTQLAEDLIANSWLITGSRTVCPDCQSHIGCTLVGHDMQPWTSLTHLGLPGRMRSCNHCGTAEFDPPPPPVHRTAPTS